MDWTPCSMTLSNNKIFASLVAPTTCEDFLLSSTLLTPLILINVATVTSAISPNNSYRHWLGITAL